MRVNMCVFHRADAESGIIGGAFMNFAELLERGSGSRAVALSCRQGLSLCKQQVPRFPYDIFRSCGRANCLRVHPIATQRRAT